MKFPKFSGLLIFSSQLSKSHRTHPRTSKFSVILFGGLGWGYKAPGRAQREFCPSRFGRKGGIFWQPLRRSLLLFLVNFFQTGRSAFCSKVIDRGALSKGGRIQWWCERTQLNSGTLSDGKKLFCGGTEQQIFPSPNEGAQRGRSVFCM